MFVGFRINDNGVSLTIEEGGCTIEISFYSVSIFIVFGGIVVLIILDEITMMIKLLRHPFISYFLFRCYRVCFKTTFFVIFLLFFYVLYFPTCPSTIWWSFEGFTSLHEICTLFSWNEILPWKIALILPNTTIYFFTIILYFFIIFLINFILDVVCLQFINEVMMSMS